MRGDMTNRSRQVIGLDLIRFAAAVLVVAYHYGFWANVVHASDPYIKFTRLEPYVCHGFVGVDIFFVLSGVVIAYSAEQSTALRFARSRILRLYPAVWICATITFLALLRNHAPLQTTVLQWLNSIVLSPIGHWVDPSYWTLGVEMSFYLLLFLLLLGNRFRYVAPVMTLVGLLSTAIFAYAYAVQHAQILAGHPSTAFLAFLISRPAYLLLLRHGPLFTLGVLLWLCFYHGFTTLRAIGLGVFFAGSILAVNRDWVDIVYFSGVRFSSMPSLLLWLAAMLAIVVSLAWNQQIARAVGPRGASLIRVRAWPPTLSISSISSWAISSSITFSPGCPTPRL
jgi:peptidoglycan/LPS O-acetylase OafA/YrhL